MVIHAPGLAGHAVAPPRRDRARERVLHGVLGQLEVADLPDQGREHDGSLLAERLGDRGRDGVVAHARLRLSSSDSSSPSRLAVSDHHSTGTTGRTSTVPQRAGGIRAASASASSRSAHSTR